MTSYSLGFAKYPSGVNCPIDRIVSTEDDCKAASVALVLKYEGKAFSNLASRPAGCYWKNTDSYFNKVVDPSQTSPENFGSRGGVCIYGKFVIVIEAKIFT